MPITTHLAAALIAFALTIVGRPGGALAATPVASPDETKAIERLVEDYKAKGITDAAVLVARDGVPVFRQAYGLANREWGIANAPDAAFRIGSMTKQFTALAILQLAEARKLSLDDPISRFIDDAPPAWRQVTVRHLLTHTSGIPNFTSLPDWVGQTWMNRSPGDLVRFVRDLPLDSEPGARFQYDNTGYVILGLIVQKASGQSLGDYLAAHVFTPLGMQHTGFVGDQVVTRRASGYVRDGQTWLGTLWVSGFKDSGAGALYSTVDDLLRWDRALYDPKRLALADLKPMFTDYGHGYGFGYVIEKQDGHPLWWHNGHIDGFSSIIARYPDDRLTIIILCNDDGARIGLLSRAIAAVLLRTPQH